ncbi:MAG: 4-hydroxythreonine-4-phosphate dehydrogenase PdxA [Bacteroidetes bacterium]|nr:MAG: 4-hydroxythreonine-4-phosphate dehydrogenase PdxA [Bacteroidota bacterium]
MENPKSAQRKMPKPVIGITHGDINDASYEVLMDAFSDSRVFDFFTPIVYGSSKAASYYRKLLKREDFNFNLIKRADFAHTQRANIINITDKEIRIERGRATEEAAKMGILSLDLAINDLTEGLLDALVTFSVGSRVFRLAGTAFHALDEYLTSVMKTDDLFLFLVNDMLRVGFVTGHIPFREVLPKIRKELVTKRIEQMHQSLQRDFGVVSPSIAVLALNPHCDVVNEMGAEEQQQIMPAIDHGKAAGIRVEGPFDAGRFFSSESYRKFDAVLAMYHNQGFLPMRTYASTNTTLCFCGLPFMVTQPVFDKKGGGLPRDPWVIERLRNAFFLAQTVVQNRKRYDAERPKRQVPMYHDRRD